MYAPSRLNRLVLCHLLLVLAIGSAQTNNPPSARQPAAKPLPPGITEVMTSPRYADTTWSLLVADLNTGETVYELDPDALLFTGSVRKTFSVGFALHELGADHRFETPVYRLGSLDEAGVLDGDLVLVAGGDLTLGGRTLPNGNIAFTPFDHNEANSLGVATLTKPDPLTGIRALAAEVAASGITRITGEVVVDDRLFESFRVPNGNVLITPVIINDNRVDVTVTPTTPGEPAVVTWRPESSAFEVAADVMTVAAGGETDVTLDADATSGRVSGTIAVDYTPGVPGVESFVRTFPIEDPSSYARTILIEALVAAGVKVDADPRGANPTNLLPARDAYADDTKVASLVSPPYAEYAKLILKVSHNLGANLSLMLGGLANGALDRDAALAAEREVLTREFGLDGEGFSFPTNGSGSPDSMATARTIVDLLAAMQDTTVFETYREGFPKLGVDGSLASVGVDSPAKGKVYGKTGTTVDAKGIYKAQVLAGYIDAKSGRRLAYAIVMNDIGPFTGLDDALAAFDAEGQIATVIYLKN